MQDQQEGKRFPAAVFLACQNKRFWKQNSATLADIPW